MLVLMANKKTLSKVAAVLLLLVILGLFAYYISNHPDIIKSLKHLELWVLILLLALYGVMLTIWMGVYNTVLELCDKPLPRKENFLLTTYSTLANFFLPLQSGPGVRAVYLKKKHKVSVSSYIMASLLYFAIYSVISAAFLLVFSSYWYLTIPAILAVALVSYGVIYLAKSRFEKKGNVLKLNLNKKTLIKLFLLTLSQLTLQTIIYATELRSIGLHFSVLRAFSYTGAASFSLFVSLTPGAIGFREAFLEFSRSIHHFTTNNILSANLIDRGVFILFLACLFIVMLMTHAKNKLNL